MKKHLGLLILFLCSTALTRAQDTNIPVSKIWGEKGAYHAFADIVRFRGNFYCAFREGKSHVSAGESGKIRIIRSRDGADWESVSLIEREGVDLRDPKLSVTPDSRILITMAGAVFGEGEAKQLYPMVAYSDKSGKTFSPAERGILDASIEPTRDWLWRVTWHKGTGYGIDYQLKENARDRSTLEKDAWRLYLMKTRDGKDFENIARLDVEDLPNESTVRFDKNDRMYALIRREAGDRNGMIGVSEYPYTKWNYTKLDYRLGGPNFVFLNDQLVIGTRLYGEKTRTGILVTDLKGKILKTITLPSGGDTSYPGMIFHKKELWVVYYSSHEGNADIYLAKIPLKDLEVQAN